MNFDKLLEKLQKMLLVDSDGFKYEFKTLTLFFNPEKGTKISVRWAQGLDFSSDYEPSLVESLDGIRAAVVSNEYPVLKIEEL